jgi:hypothetical protein
MCGTNREFKVIRRVLSSLRIVNLVTMLSAMASLPASAREIVSGNWSGGSYYDPQVGSFTHCAVSSAYRSGDTLIFSLNREGQFGIGIHNPSWSLVSSDVYPVKIKVDQYSLVYGEARPVGAQLAAVYF